MSKDKDKSKDKAGTRADVLAALHRAVRETSAQSALFSSAVAAHLGITTNDLECLDLIYLNGPMTAGRLADITGLTTGAITGIVDRLSAAGLVRREPDPADRRRVIVRVEAVAGERVYPFYISIEQRSKKRFAELPTKQLKFLLDFYRESNVVLREETARLRQSDGGARKSRKSGKPKKPAKGRSA